jgi:hypothetical protein
MQYCTVVERESWMKQNKIKNKNNSKTTQKSTQKGLEKGRICFIGKYVIPYRALHWMGSHWPCIIPHPVLC